MERGGYIPNCFRFVWCGILPLVGGGAVRWERDEAPQSRGTRASSAVPCSRNAGECVEWMRLALNMGEGAGRESE